MEGGRVDEVRFPLALQVSKGHSHNFFTSQRKEFAKWTIEGMHLPTGRNEEKRFTGGVKNCPALALGAFHQGVLLFEGTHGLLGSMLVALNRIGHAIDGLTDLV